MSTSISILGNTGRDVELRYTPQGTPVASFSVASNSVRNTSQGKVKKTDWYDVSAFGKQAETLARHLKKGSQILVRGKLTFKPWLGDDGTPRVNANVILQDFDFAGGVKDGNHPANEKPVAATARRAENSSEPEATMPPEVAAAFDGMDDGDEPFAGQF